MGSPGSRAGTLGVEPRTTRLTAVHSTELSYMPINLDTERLSLPSLPVDRHLCRLAFKVVDNDLW